MSLRGAGLVLNALVVWLFLVSGWCASVVLVWVEFAVVFFGVWFGCYLIRFAFGFGLDWFGRGSWFPWWFVSWLCCLNCGLAGFSGLGVLG